MESWRIDELAHAGPEHLDPAYVAGYEAKSGYDPSDDLDALAARGFGPRSTLVDLGAGTGVFALAAAARCARVVAVDVSPAMLEVLERRVAERGLDNVRVVQAGLLSYDHQGDPPDAVFTRNALHHLPDFWKGLALERIRTLLAPGGVLRLDDLIFDMAPAEVPERLEAWFAGAAADPAAGYTASELAAHVRTEFSTYSWLMDVLLEQAGFEVVDRDFRRGAYGAYTCVRAR